MKLQTDRCLRYLLAPSMIFCYKLWKELYEFWSKFELSYKSKAIVNFTLYCIYDLEDRELKH